METRKTSWHVFKCIWLYKIFCDFFLINVRRNFIDLCIKCLCWNVTGPNIKTAIAILNCLLARQLCFDDASCSAILEIIPRVCGPELGKYKQWTVCLGTLNLYRLGSIGKRYLFSATYLHCQILLSSDKCTHNI